MPDLLMCTNKKCTRNKSCYRFMAQPNFIQYSNEFKKIRDFDNCPFFIEIGERRVRLENDPEPIPGP